MKRSLLGLLLLLGSSLTAAAQSSGDGYNPDNPQEPSTPSTLMNYAVTLQNSMDGAGALAGAGVYKYGTNVTIKATANTGYKFLYWQKGDAAEPYNTNAQFTYNVAVGDVRFTAVYEKLKKVTASVNNSAAGTVSGGGLFATGTTATLTATPSSNFYAFLYWTKDGASEPFSTEKSITYEVGDEDTEFCAVFDCPPQVSVLVNDNAAGTAKYTYNSNVVGTARSATLTATPNTKYRLVHWLRNDETEPYTTEPSFVYELDDDVKFTAVFRWNPDNPNEPSEMEKLTKHEVKVAVNDNAAGIVSGGGKYLYNKSVTISTSPNAGYRFLHWLKDDEETPYKTTASFTYTMGVEDVSFKAVYEAIPPPVVPDSHKLNLVPGIQGSCTFSMASGTSIQEGSSFSVTVTPGPEHVFRGWYQNGVLVATTPTYGSYMDTEDITLTALCEYVPESPEEPNNPGGFIPEVEVKGILGDVNGDQSVDVMDALMLINLYISDRTKDVDNSVGDVNKDESVDVMDALEIINKYIKGN